jgi:hypothetical protein
LDEHFVGKSFKQKLQLFRIIIVFGDYYKIQMRHYDFAVDFERTFGIGYHPDVFEHPAIANHQQTNKQIFPQHGLTAEQQAIVECITGFLTGNQKSGQLVNRQRVIRVSLQQITERTIITSPVTASGGENFDFRRLIPEFTQIIQHYM